MKTRKYLTCALSLTLFMVACSNDKNNNAGGPQDGPYGTYPERNYSREGVYDNGECAPEIVVDYNKIYVHMSNAEGRIRNMSNGSNRKNDDYCRYEQPGHGRYEQPGHGRDDSHFQQPPRVTSQNRYTDSRSNRHDPEDLNHQHPSRSRGNFQNQKYNANAEACRDLDEAYLAGDDFLNKYGTDVVCRGGQIHQNSDGPVDAESVERSLDWIGDLHNQYCRTQH